MLEHSKNVAEVARALLELLPVQVRNQLGNSAEVAAALHDLGKVSPGYQLKYFRDSIAGICPDLAKRGVGDFEPPYHATISEAAISGVLGTNLAPHPLAVAVGAHHGIRDEPQTESDAASERMGGPAWAAQRRGLYDELVKTYGPLDPDANLDVDLLAGLISVADWLGSDEDLFPPEGLSTSVDLAIHAKKALQDSGWHLARTRSGLSFQDVFGDGFEPYPAQRDFIDAVTGPGVYVLEAPMGLGKTEAALYAAYRLIDSGQAYGLYFGLPTRLTSDRIHLRVQQFIENISEGSEPVRLAHGLAWLRGFFDTGGCELDAGGSWFRPSKRALLMPYAVGTIDQALLAVLKVRHHFVRSFGLAGKVVILDEVHSYDVYTGTLLDLLVRRLREIGATVIILSATLTRARRASFLSADLDNACEDYPLITADAGGEVESIHSEGPATKTVEVEVSPLDDHAVAEHAATKAAAGQAVLCIANTVARAQQWYSLVKAERAEGSFEVGLLHSAFPAWRRSRLEDLWMERLGKEGDRSRGSVLVATQVVEQSVDIDADSIITELAPTDMLLQRLGRLWRHDRGDRNCQTPSVIIVTGEMGRVSSDDDLQEALGPSNCRVYQPYVLWRSRQVLGERASIRLPDDIRELLEATYAPASEDEPEWLAPARARLEARRDKLRRLAQVARADKKGYCTMPDDERAATRYSEVIKYDAVLARELDVSGFKATLTLSDGTTVKVNAAVKNPWVTTQLQNNKVGVPHYRLPEAKTPKYLTKHAASQDPTPVLLIGDDGRLSIDGAPTELSYDDERGLRQRAPKTKPKAAIAPSSPALEDEDEWEGGLDEFGW